MRTRYATLLAAAALAAGVGTAARAQLPFLPDPEPDFRQRAQCTRDYVRSVAAQVATLEKLHKSGPEAIGRVCSLIEAGSAWLGSKLPDDTRRELRNLLGVDVDLDLIAAQCRAGQDNVESELATRIHQLRSELVRCDDTV